MCVFASPTWGLGEWLTTPHR